MRLNEPKVCRSFSCSEVAYAYLHEDMPVASIVAVAFTSQKEQTHCRDKLVLNEFVIINYKVQHHYSGDGPLQPGPVLGRGSAQTTTGGFAVC